MSTIRTEQALHETIRSQLRYEILSGILPVGQPLRQDALARRFHASRIPVREALRQLESEGLVMHHLNRGAVVAGMSLEQICEVLDIRIALECHAAKLSVPNMVESDFQTMENILTAYSRAETVQEWAEYNRRFHLALTSASNNRRLRRLIEDFCLNTDRYTHVLMSKATGKEGPQSDHYRILEACRRRDTQEVVRLLEEHINETRRELLAIARAGDDRPTLAQPTQMMA
jgi:DNA-binding GntR family transcriptional regulator